MHNYDKSVNKRIVFYDHCMHLKKENKGNIFYLWSFVLKIWLWNEEFQKLSMTNECTLCLSSVAISLFCPALNSWRLMNWSIIALYNCIANETSSGYLSLSLSEDCKTKGKKNAVYCYLFSIIFSFMAKSMFWLEALVKDSPPHLFLFKTQSSRKIKNKKLPSLLFEC